MKFQTLGHSCLLVTTENGTRIVFDPFEASIGYPEPRVEAEIVCTSHDHFDHNNVSAIQNAKLVLRTSDAAELNGVKHFGADTFHDEKQGALRGKNVLHIIEADGMRIVHMGDIGHPLSAETVETLGAVDVMMIPVGGVYTVDAAGAKAIIDAVQPRVILPMHYQTSELTLGSVLASIKSFATLFDTVEYAEDAVTEICVNDGKSGVIVLNTDKIGK